MADRMDAVIPYPLQSFYPGLPCTSEMNFAAAVIISPVGVPGRLAPFLIPINEAAVMVPWGCVYWQSL